MRALQNYACRGVRHLGGLSAHDPCYRLRGVPVAYDEHIAFKNPLFIVYGRNLFPIFGSPYDQPCSRDFGYIECVERLPCFEHDVVRNVNRVIYGPYARRFKPFSEPIRRLSDFNSLDYPHRVPAAKRSILDANLNPVACFKPTLFKIYSPLLHWNVADGGDFSRKPHDAQTIRPVRGNSDLKERVIKVERVFNVNAEFGVRRQYHYAFGSLGKSQLYLRAHHAPRLNAPDFTLFYDYAFRKASDRYDLGNVNPAYLGSGIMHGLNLNPCHGELVGKLDRRESDINEF